MAVLRQNLDPVLPVPPLAAWALRLLMQMSVELPLYRSWPGPRQLQVRDGAEMTSSRAELVPRRLKLVPSVQPLAVQRLSRLAQPLQVMFAWALRLLMQDQVEQHP